MHEVPLLETTCIDHIKQCSIIFMLYKVIMELILDYECSCILIQFFPEFSHVLFELW